MTFWLPQDNWAKWRQGGKIVKFGDQKVCEKTSNYCRLQAKDDPRLAQVVSCTADWHARMNLGRVSPPLFLSSWSRQS